MLAWLQRPSWRGLRLLGALQERLRRRLTPAGRVVLAGTLTAGLFGVDTRQSLAFQAFSLGAALLALAWVGSLRRPVRLRALRRLPRHATVGEPVRYGVELTNLGARAAGHLELEETLPDPRPDWEAFERAGRAPGPGRNPLGLLSVYPRWRSLLARGRWAEAPPAAPVAHIGPGGVVVAQLRLVPRRRGVLRLDGLRVARREPLGLGLSPARVGEPERLLVLPRRYPVAPQRLPGRRRLQPGGVRLAASVGDSREFVGLRDYRPGDSPRHMHWAGWAHGGEPVVKEYQDEYFSRQALVLDSFVAAGREGDFEAAVSVAASLAEPLQGRDALLDLMFCADRVHTLTAGRGLASTRLLLETLACVRPAERGDFAFLGRSVLGHAPRLGGCLCVLLEWDPPRRDLAGRLRALGVEVRILVVGGSGPLEPGPMADRPADLRRLDPSRLGEELRAR
jgi:uncharacterized protein (DUF58 family)